MSSMRQSYRTSVREASYFTRILVQICLFTGRQTLPAAASPSVPRIFQGTINSKVIADPHCHTLSSDGMVTPAQLVDAAVTARLDLIAITDHDTMASVKETQERGSAAGLTVVAGQEITSRWPAQT